MVNYRSVGKRLLGTQRVANTENGWYGLPGVLTGEPVQGGPTPPPRLISPFHHVHDCKTEKVLSLSSTRGI